MAEQERLIELLKEKRQAVISHAVTKGLNPKAPMKPSGIDWLGDVPEHWEILPFKYVVSAVESGTSVNSVDDPASDTDLGVLKTSCVYRGSFDLTENKTVVLEEHSRVSCPLRLHALIVSRMNTPDLVGAAGLVKEIKNNIFLPDRLWQVTLASADPRFAHYWTLSSLYRAQVHMACSGTSSTMQNLSQGQFFHFIFPNPPRDEQLRIADVLDQELDKIDLLVSGAERASNILQERRTALISAAVTGKIDVRGLVKNKKQEAA